MPKIQYYLCENSHYFPFNGDHTCPTCGSTSEGHCISNGGPGRIFYICMLEEYDVRCDTCHETRRPWEVACTSYLADGVVKRTCRFCTVAYARLKHD